MGFSSLPLHALTGPLHIGAHRCPQFFSLLPRLNVMLTLESTWLASQSHSICFTPDPVQRLFMHL